MEQEQIIKKLGKVTGILDILICLLLLISSLYKGGFYKEDSLFVSMIICLLGLVCLSVKIVLNIRDNRKITKSKLETLVDICVMLMPIAYFMPVLFGKCASKELAIFETIRYINFAIIYFIVRTTSNKKIYLTSIVMIGLVLAILGIDEITYRGLIKLLEPISISYLSETNGKISSTLQYANITGLFMLVSCIIVQSKLVKNLPKLHKENKLEFKIIVVLELFSLILLQSAIFLTTSRMNILMMIVISIMYSGYCAKKAKRKSAIMIVLMLFAALGLVSSIDSYLLVKNNFMICFTYIITFIIIALGVMLSCKFQIDQSYNIEKNKKSPKNILIISILGITTLFILFLTPSELRINDNTKQGSMITRNIYTTLQETMDVNIKFDFHKNNSFVLELYEIDENFNKKSVISITQKSVKDGTYSEQISISNTAESLMLTLKAIDSDISIKEFKLNDKKITLSYKFIPDSIIFRLKDTLIKDSNNTLRFIYYKDALKLFNMSKLVGIGGEGFKSRYQEVQTENYISSEVHSVPLQILVESGIIGFLAFITICVATFIIVYRLYKIKNEQTMPYALMLIAFIATSVFDLVFSFGIMIYLFAIIIGLIIGEYKNEEPIEKDRYELDNKSVLGMLKIATLSISLMILFVVTLYCLNIYRASMIIVPDKAETIDESYERVGLLEKKIALDKYNLTYLTNLLSSYDKHIDLLNHIYILTKEDDEKFMLKTEINNYIARQKEIADNIIEYEYYNKYALDSVARCYFKRYISYADIFNSNFKNDEIAYVFYTGYAIKLTHRITKIGKVNTLAKNMAYNIYDEYLTVLERHNNIINSKMLAQVIEDMKTKKESLK